MKRICKATALLLAALLLICGCAQVPPDGKRPAITIHAKHLSFQIGSWVDSSLAQEARNFARHVEDISNGALVIDIVEAETTADTLVSGECAFAFLENAQFAQVNSAFHTFSFPFLYSSPAQMSVKLNHELLLAYMSERVSPQGLTPLAALGGSESYLVSTQSGMIMPSHFEGVGVALHPGNADLLSAFETLGAVVLPYQQVSLLPLLDQEASPPSQTEVQTVVVRVAEATIRQLLEPTDDTKPLYAIRSSHDLSPIWFAASVDHWEQLTAWEQAVIHEACSGMVGAWETRRASERAHQEKKLEKRGISLEDIECEAMATTLYGSSTSNGQYALPEYFDKKLYELMQEDLG